MQLHKVLHILLSSVLQEIGVKIKIDGQDNHFGAALDPSLQTTLGHTVLVDL